jgi:FAD/FMN-containing dehydrogenase
MNRRRFMQGTLAAAAATALPTGRALAAVYYALTQVTGDLKAVTGDGREVVLPRADVQALSDSLRGRLLLPGNEGYEAARRVMNGSIDRHPAVIAQCMGAADVSRAVSFAQEFGLLVAVKCGGHSYAGKSTCDGGLQIDLSPLQGVRVDPVARIARVPGGSLLGSMDAESMAFGLVTTAGTVSHTGVGGLTLGGGFGRVGRRFGLALDNVRAVDIVTADGEFRRASPEENPDLYWAVRGGGGNFGVVTSFEFQLHPMERQVVGGDIVFPFEQASQVLEFYADYCAEAPDDLYLDFFMAKNPGEDPGVVGLHACYSGPKSRADAVLGPVRKAGKAVDDGIKAVDYVAIQKSWDWTDPRMVSTYLKSGFVSGIGPEVVARLIDGFEADPGRRTSVFFQQSGGAIGRVAPDATAFAHRHASHNMFCTVSWDPAQDGARHVDYIRKWWATLEPSTNGWYTNEISNESFAKVRANYQGNFERLVQVKGRYDPANLFRLNANVPPST